MQGKKIADINSGMDRNSIFTTLLLHIHRCTKFSMKTYETGIQKKKKKKKKL